MLMVSRKHFRSKKSRWLFPKWRFLHLNVLMFKKKINIKKTLKRSVMFTDFSNVALIVVFLGGFSKYYGKNVRIGDFRWFFLKWRNPHLKWRFLYLKWRFGPLFVVLAKFQKFWCKKKWIGDFQKFSEILGIFFQSGESPLKVKNPHLKWRIPT